MTPTREQVRALLAAKDDDGDAEGDYWLTHNEEVSRDYGIDLYDLDVKRLADAVMALLADTAPEVLWEGETVGRSSVCTPDSVLPFPVPVPPGTRVAVVAVPVVAGEPEPVRCRTCGALHRNDWDNTLCSRFDPERPAGEPESTPAADELPESQHGGVVCPRPTHAVLIEGADDPYCGRCGWLVDLHAETSPYPRPAWTRARHPRAADTQEAP